MKQIKKHTFPYNKMLVRAFVSMYEHKADAYETFYAKKWERKGKNDSKGRQETEASCR